MQHTTMDHLIPETVRRSVELVHPQRIGLFGSRASGPPRPSSDRDLPGIAKSSGPRYPWSAPLYSVLSDLPSSMDVMVYTPEEVE